MRRLTPLPIYWVLLFFCSPLFAATSWYQVELIIFQQPRADQYQGELWSSAATALPPGVAELLPYPNLRAFSDRTQEIRGGTEVAWQATPFAILPSKQFNLDAVAKKIERQPGYRLLLHTAWQQPGLSRSKAIPLHLHDAINNSLSMSVDRYQLDNLGGQLPHPGSRQSSALLSESYQLARQQNSRNPSYFDGIVTLTLSRFLHLHVDLTYLRANNSGGTVSEVDNLTNVNQGYPHMKDSRRMRSNETHYIDHPLLGIIARITPL
ncbi:MAG: hypothetical protein HQL49_10980 [Gammaproteobacteria bacterium]|nr:hypothetical protein [Gammaproteobacteria bacterium]